MHGPAVGIQLHPLPLQFASNAMVADSYNVLFLDTTTAVSVRDNVFLRDTPPQVRVIRSPGACDTPPQVRVQCHYGIARFPQITTAAPGAALCSRDD